MIKYNPFAIEKKWQKFWQAKKVFFSSDKSKKPKKYILTEFPYPSGEGLHMGHLRPYVASDVVSRYSRARGFETMFPFGWDAFGLPTENYAIKHGIQPELATAQNIKNARRQVLSWGISFDWSREVNTTDPSYYKWTQWLFLQFFKAGLAYEAEGMINWCPKDKTGLANEEVIDGKCERCGTVVEKKNLRQWFLKITAYAEQLLEGLKNLPLWPEAVKQQQQNWIGKKEGINITYKIEHSSKEVVCFTTRPETNFGATFIVIGPEHPLLAEQNTLGLKDEIWKAIQNYKEQSAEITEMDRTDLSRKKTGVFTNFYAVNELNSYRMPLYVADYVLGNVGTGAVVGVPAHDKRDFEFAEAFNLPVVRVVQKSPQDNAPIKKIEDVQEDEGTMVNSEFLNGLDIHAATLKMMDYLEAKGYGKRVINYKLRDWLFSRQRYWGEPIPIIHCEGCGVVAIPEKDLPVLLPKVKKYEPTGTGESPLAAIDSWVNVKCPECGKPAKRETNTMPQWAGSSWYFLRYADPANKKEFASKSKLKHWLPIDIYFGGMEHTTLHLLYSRFWNLFLADQGLVPVKEPYARRQPHGIILAHDGEKMSKSRGNVANPDQIVKSHGADALRMYELFLGPHEQMVSWNEQGINGVRRFLDRSWNFVLKNYDLGLQANSPKAETEINKLIKKVGEDIDGIKFNTAVAALMGFLNEVNSEKVSKKLLEDFLVALAPFAPHIAEELWQKLGHKKSIVFAKWPEFDVSKIESATVQFVVQVAGRFRANVEILKDATQAEVALKSQEIPTVKNAIGSAKIKKIVFVPNRLINFVLEN